MVDLNPEQYVSLLANDLYPRGKRQGTMFETERDPIMVQFAKDMRYDNLNGIVDHRYHRVEHRANLMPNSGSTTDVNWYIEDCKNYSMTEGYHYAVLTT